MMVPSLWIVTVPGGRQYEVMALTIEQALEFVAAKLGRSCRLTPRHIGERGSVWFVTVEGSETVVAPTVFLEAV